MGHKCDQLKYSGGGMGITFDQIIVQIDAVFGGT
jgi:hypothetical protein